ncbi:MAG TPA: hypothetical protein VF486_07335 [Actinomycetes bacterium]
MPRRVRPFPRPFASLLGNLAPSGRSGWSVLAQPRSLAVALTSLVARLPKGMVPLAIVLEVGRAKGTYLAAGGLLLAAWICGGLLGSFGFGQSTGPPAVADRYRRLLARFAVALAPLPATAALPPAWRLPLLAVLLVTAGLWLTPVAATSYLLVERVATARHRTEAFTWLSTALAGGLAAGASLAGALTDRLGPTAALVLPAAAVGGAALICRRRLGDTAAG